ncbi:unnamed protein product (macronuclear) [Paramecium tetraurelia]|uniref:Transmembrane protein n=1 Tax=Paramecium tetraurelia TaxID=5888 RepID=A0D7S7_PARTE|nr:uncharacterized protein GSPATT00014061001 [Paramecium tetraurelia]CAK79094.1 unnamed protein product [Paramecium tetraurelia]|eukprot:XP_001446491.1 hypothetical protein (macronuclear) [Paramecium tetraurelia strain d4-2]
MLQNYYYLQLRLEKLIEISQEAQIFIRRVILIAKLRTQILVTTIISQLGLNQKTIRNLEQRIEKKQNIQIKQGLKYYYGQLLKQSMCLILFPNRFKYINEGLSPILIKINCRITIQIARSKIINLLENYLNFLKCCNKNKKFF